MFAAWPIIASISPPAPLAVTRLIFTGQAAFLDGYNDLTGREGRHSRGWATWTQS